MEEELKYHTDILILEILAHVYAIYMVVGENNAALHYANSMLSAHALATQQRTDSNFQYEPIRHT